MKKIFTLLSLLFALAASAQTVQFYYHGEPLADGATVTIEAEEDDWGDIVCESNPTSNPANGLILRNLTGNAVNGQATLTIDTNTLEPIRVQWCMGGLCVIVSGNTFDKTFAIQPNSYIMTQFDALPNQEGEMTATIAVRVGLTETVSVNVHFVYGAKPAFVRRSVVEEFTGAWCGNCPRGIVGLQRLSEDFGDRAILIAVHTGDPMEIPTYPNVQTDLLPGSGAPSCAIDRVKVKLDPYSGSGQRGIYHYGIDADFAAALSRPTEAQVELQAQWNEAGQRKVRFTATTTFNIDSPTEPPYRLIFILTEDGLTGTGSDWRQVNYASSSYEDSNYKDDDMAYWREAPYYVTGVEYNHVPVNTLGVQAGIAGSITPITAYEPQVYSDNVTVMAAHAQKLIQDKSRLQAVAILINTTTGEVVNAAKSTILPYGDNSGISSPNSPSPDHNTEGPTYNLNGQRITTPSRGLYIQNGKKLLAP